MLPTSYLEDYCHLYYPLQYQPTLFTFSNDFVAELMKTQESLQKELSQYKIKIEVLEKEKRDYVREMVDRSFEKDQARPQVPKLKKQFSKDRKCLVDGCKRKYSSKIALNAHLRIKHPRFKAETLEYLP